MNLAVFPHQCVPVGPKIAQRMLGRSEVPLPAKNLPIHDGFELVEALEETGNSRVTLD